MITKYGWKSLGFNSYKEYLLSDIWKQKRDAILKLFPKCYCGRKATEVHHKTYINCGNEKKEDLACLCFICHKEKENE